MKKIFILCLILFSWSSIVFAGAGTTTLTIATLNAPTQPYTMAFEKWGEMVAEKTNGAVKVDVFHSSSLCANHQECFGQVKAGSIDMSMLNVVKDYVPELQVSTLPYAFKSYDSLREFMDSEYVQNLYEEFREKTGVRILAFQHLGTRHLTANKKILRPSDLKGLKIRSVELPIYMDMVTGLGAIPTPVAFQEVLGALKSGIIDGQENPIPTIYQMKFYEVQKYVMLTGHLAGGDFWMMNDKKFQSFSPEIQRVLEESAHEAALWGDQLVLKQEKELKEEIEKKGVVFIGPEQGLDVDAFANSVRSYVWPMYEEEIGKEAMDRVLEY